MLKNILRTAFLFIAILHGTLPSNTLADTKTISVLDRGEPFEAMVFHDNFLWIGKSRQQFGSHYKLEIFDAQSVLRATLSLPHSATFLYPHGPHSVLVVGTAATPNLTHYTIVDQLNGQFKARTVVIPAEAWAHRWLGSVGNREYFTDPGGNSNDPEGEKNPTLAAQTLFSMRGGNPSYLPLRLRLPLEGIQLGSIFFLLHSEGIGQASTNLMRIDPAQNKMVQVFPTARNGLISLVARPDASALALIERNASQVLLVNPTTLSQISTIKLANNLRTVTNWGKCLLVGASEVNKITAIDISRNNDPKILGSIDIELPKTEFFAIRRLAANTATQTLYVRSSVACNPMAEACTTDRNRVIALTGNALSQWTSACLSH